MPADDAIPPPQRYRKPRPWSPPSPALPVDPARMAAMCRAILLMLRGPESAEVWGEDIAGELLRATRRLSRMDRERLQVMIDGMVDRLNEGEAEREAERSGEGDGEGLSGK